MPPNAQSGGSGIFGVIGLSLIFLVVSLIN